MPDLLASLASDLRVFDPSSTVPAQLLAEVPGIAAEGLGNLDFVEEFRVFLGSEKSSAQEEAAEEKQEGSFETGSNPAPVFPFWNPIWYVRPMATAVPASFGGSTVAVESPEAGQVLVSVSDTISPDAKILPDQRTALGADGSRPEFAVGSEATEAKGLAVAKGEVQTGKLPAMDPGERARSTVEFTLNAAEWSAVSEPVEMREPNPSSFEGRTDDPRPDARVADEPWSGGPSSRELLADSAVWIPRPASESVPDRDSMGSGMPVALPGPMASGPQDPLPAAASPSPRSPWTAPEQGEVPGASPVIAEMSGGRPFAEGRLAFTARVVPAALGHTSESSGPQVSGAPASERPISGRPLAGAPVAVPEPLPERVHTAVAGGSPLRPRETVALNKPAEGPVAPSTPNSINPPEPATRTAAEGALPGDSRGESHGEGPAHARLARHGSDGPAHEGNSDPRQSEPGREGPASLPHRENDGPSVFPTAMTAEHPAAVGREAGLRTAELTPVMAVAPEVDLPIERPAPVPRELVLTIPGREQGDAALASVYVRDQNGAVEIAVRTPDSQLSTSLQESLPDLVTRLETHGTEVSAARGDAPDHGAGDNSAGEGSGDPRDRQDPSGRQQNSQEQPHGRPGEQRRERQARWQASLAAQQMRQNS